MEKSLQTSSRTLSSYYSRLFVLPTTRRILIYNLLASLAISYLLSSKLLSAFIIFVITTVVGSALLVVLGKLADVSILSYRRALGLTFVNLLFFLSCLILSLPSRLMNNFQHVSDIVAYATIIAVGFNLVVIRGVFCKNFIQTLAFAVVFPLLTYAILYMSSIVLTPSIFSILLGIVLLLVASLFLSRFSRVDRSLHYSPINMLQAFIYTWVAGEPRRLEEIFAANSSTSSLETTVISLTADRKLYLIVPGVHPGPLDPVGSYDLPELFFNQFKDVGLAVTLHGTGSHERNLPTNDMCKRYVLEVKEQILQDAGEQTDSMKGPISESNGTYNATAWIIKEHMFITLSAAPYGSDDLDPHAFEEVTHILNKLGLRCSIIDAHNSISSNANPTINIDWKSLVNKLILSEQRKILAGWANSNEISFNHQDDLFDAGITVVLFRLGGEDFVLVAADSNNSLPQVREQIISLLARSNAKLIEFCTSDTHKSAGRGLRSLKGYYSLGERTSVAELNKAVERLVELARQRIKECICTVSTVRSTFPIIGKEVLERLVNITTSGAKLAKNYAIVASLIFLLSILAINLL